MFPLSLLVCSSDRDRESSKTRIWFENVGTPEAPDFDARGTLDIDAPRMAAPAFADVDGDGDEDLFVGTNSGGVLFFERR